MRSIGLTGGIASGKSTVSKTLADHGAALIDADLLGHRTYEPGSETFDQVVERFGADLVGEDGQIDRKILGGKVFGEPDGMKKLTDIVWPGIRRLATEELQRLASEGTEVAILEAAVMIEAGWQDLVDEVWVVTVPPETARERLMERNGLSAEDADKRINSQLTNDERSKHADVIISTDFSFDEVTNRVNEVWSALQERIAGGAR